MRLLITHNERAVTMDTRISLWAIRDWCLFTLVLAVALLMHPVDAKAGESAVLETAAKNKRENEVMHKQYSHIAAETPIMDVVEHPAFRGFGHLVFPWNDTSRYHGKLMNEAHSLNLWHSNMDTKEMVAGINRMIDDISMGNAVFHDFYTPEEKADDPSKKLTGLFFFRGELGAPFAVVSPGGGFTYVGSIHEGFPLAMEISKRGYNAFVLKYRVQHPQGELAASQDLIAAVNWIRDNAASLGIAAQGYSLWGGSAGARISSNASYGEGGIERPNLLHPAAVVMAYTTYPGHPEFSRDDPAGFIMVGDQDWIVPVSHSEKRVAAMKAVGVGVEFLLYRGIGHGYGVGNGTVAAGWMDKALNFWERQEE